MKSGSLPNSVERGVNLPGGDATETQAAFGGRYARIDPGPPIEARARDRVRDGSACHLLLVSRDRAVMLALLAR
jgi:hypothetical protein